MRCARLVLPEAVGVCGTSGGPGSWTRRLGVGVVAVLAVMIWSSSSAAQVDTVKYTVEKGDTCESIAEDFYEHEGGCALIEKYNTEDGEAPEFEPGEVLELPKKVTKAEARVDRKHGSVRAREPDRSWHSAAVGEPLFRSWRINTLESARARLSFRDRSRLKMRQQTLVIIYGGSREKTQRKRKRAKLAKGTLRSKLSELSGEDSARVDSPTARAEMSGGNVLFDVDGDGTTRVANHGGPAVEVSGKGSNAARKSVSVRAGMGTKVSPGRPPSTPQELPPPPDWKDTSDVVSLGGDPVDVSATWKAVDEAEEYFVELAADSEGIEMLESAYVPADVRRVEVQGVRPGAYYATVSTIDADEFEGIPSDRVEMRVWSISYDETNRLESDGTPTFVLGTELSVPSALRCGVDEGELETTLRLRKPGPRTIRCRTEDDGEVRPREVRVEVPETSVGGPGASGDDIEVPARGFVSVHLDFQPRAPEQVNVTVEMEEETEAMSVPTVPVTGERWRVKLDGSKLSGKTPTLVARTKGGVELVRVPVDVRTDEVDRPARRASTASAGPRRELRFGIEVGGLVATGRGGTDVGGGGEVIVSYLHSSPFAVDLRLGMGWTTDRGVAAESRLRALGRFETGGLVPFVGGGFGVRWPLGARVAPFLDGTAGVAYPFDGGWTFRVAGGVDLGANRSGNLAWRPRVGISLLKSFR